MNIVIWGATGQSKVIIDILSKYKNNVIAFFDKNDKLISPISGVPIYNNENDLKYIFKKYSKNPISFYSCIGGLNAIDRLYYINLAKKIGFDVPNISHHKSFISSNVKIGIGNHFLANSFVGVDSFIGDGCILNTASSIDHDCFLNDGVHLAPNVTLAGNVKVGKNSTIFSGSIIGPNVKIGDNVIIGAGSLILKDIPSDTRVYGRANKLKFNKNKK